MNTFRFVCTFLFCIIAIHGFAQAPMLAGKVEISIKKGTFDCEFTLSEIPRTPDYLLLINSGMNIQSIRHENNEYKFSYERQFNSDVSDEAFGYYIPNDKGKYIPKKLHFTYTGKFPVSTDSITCQRQDWRGNIAFNGYSVRTDGLQSAWYPVVYDVSKDVRYDKVRCDIEITCNDCEVIYINGHAPVKGQKVNFKNEKPLELMLYAGNFKTYNVNNTCFINPDISKKQMKQFGEMTASFKRFYEKKLGIPYLQPITYLNSTPVSQYNAWMFVAYPTIINVGNSEYGFKECINGPTSTRKKQFVAHELGHYYFSYYKEINSEFAGVISEGFAEFLSMQAAKNLLHDTLYRASINKKLKEMEGFKPVPFSKIKTEKDYESRELYVYRFAPIIFAAINKEIGDKKMWLWCKNLLETKTNFTNYIFLKETLRTTLKNDAQTDKLISRYFESDNALRNASKKLKR